MLESISGAALAEWNNGAPLTISYSWARSSSYTEGAPINYDVNVV